MTSPQLLLASAILFAIGQSAGDPQDGPDGNRSPPPSTTAAQPAETPEPSRSSGVSNIRKDEEQKIPAHLRGCRITNRRTDDCPA